MSAPSRPTRRRWRIVDVVVAAVLAAACGALFIGWNAASQLPAAVLTPLLPGLQGLVNGPWLIAGPLVGLVIRRPGAALLGEFVAALVEFLVFPVYGVATLLSGATQGLGAELGFAATGYRRSGPGTALLAGALAGVGESITDLVVSYPGSAALFAVVYSASTVVSGAVCGLLAWAVVRALAATGALDRFASGRASGRAV